MATTEQLIAIKSLLEDVENAFFNIDNAILQCPDIKAFSAKFMRNMDIAIETLEKLTANSKTLAQPDVDVDFINTQQYQSIAK
jgi:hypothetical protein